MGVLRSISDWLFGVAKGPTSKRSFEAASGGRRTDGWLTTSQPAWDEVAASLPILRERSRHLANNNAWAKRALEVIANNTVGTGIRPNIKNKRLSKVFKDWAESTECDFEGRHNLWGLQHHIMHTVAKSGDCLVVKRFVNKVLKLQVLEGDFLDGGKNFNIGKATENYTLQGIEFNPQGQRVAYWIHDTHPMMYRGISQRVLAEDVIHVYESLRPGQIRGVPFGASVILPLRDFDEYADAQLLRQKIAACYAVFVRDNVDSGIVSDATDSLPDTIEPGMIQKLPRGMDVEFGNPPGAEGYREYTNALARQIAMGFGITYEALTGDLSQVNFSSGRMGWLEFSRNISRWQKMMMIPQFCQPMYSWFEDYAYLSKGLKGLGTSSVDWTVPRREMINPSEEIKAAVLAIDNNLMSLSEVLRQMGYDPSAVIDEIAEDREYMASKNITPNNGKPQGQSRQLE